MARFIFLFVLSLVAAGALWYLGARLSRRPFVSDTLGKILVALLIAGIAFWLFGGGVLMG